MFWALAIHNQEENRPLKINIPRIKIQNIETLNLQRNTFDPLPQIYIFLSYTIALKMSSVYLQKETKNKDFFTFHSVGTVAATKKNLQEKPIEWKRLTCLVTLDTCQAHAEYSNRFNLASQFISRFSILAANILRIPTCPGKAWDFVKFYKNPEKIIGTSISHYMQEGGHPSVVKKTWMDTMGLWKKSKAWRILFQFFSDLLVSSKPELLG